MDERTVNKSCNQVVFSFLSFICIWTPRPSVSQDDANAARRRRRRAARSAGASARCPRRTGHRPAGAVGPALQVDSPSGATPRARGTCTWSTPESSCHSNLRALCA